MRDAHRMKEKFDVTLDNRQIVSLLIAGIVVMGAVFVLGVVVGKKLASDAQTAAAPDLLSALDANAQALQQVQQEPEPHLTFPDALTAKSGAEPAAPASAKPAAKPAETKPATAAAQQKPTTPAAQSAAKPAEPTPASPVGEDDDAMLAAALKAEAAKAEAAKALAAKEAQEKEASKAVAAKETGKVEATPVATRTASKDGGLQEAIARATQQPAQPAETVKGGAFTLQLSAFQNRPEADRFSARLRDRGYAPYIVAAEVPKKGTWYRVRMGSFSSKEAAARYLADFKRETQLEAFVAGAE
ncbi:SPOR domain-containing protein [Myxococcaceae bacterium GXIMD 01537]